MLSKWLTTSIISVVKQGNAAMIDEMHFVSWHKASLFISNPNIQYRNKKCKAQCEPLDATFTLLRHKGLCDTLHLTSKLAPHFRPRNLIALHRLVYVDKDTGLIRLVQLRATAAICPAQAWMLSARARDFEIDAVRIILGAVFALLIECGMQCDNFVAEHEVAGEA